MAGAASQICVHLRTQEARCSGDLGYALGLMRGHFDDDDAVAVSASAPGASRTTAAIASMPRRTIAAPARLPGIRRVLPAVPSSSAMYGGFDMTERCPSSPEG